ncbi:MAG: hypothetical protein PF518_19480 [Spirochaetaceae bacterium]|nr:hypothetical protein [Spirochaetaceae bacterium]
MGKFPIQKPDKSTILLYLLFFLFFQYGFSQNNEDLFLSVFGDSLNSVQIIPVPLFINDQYSNDINIQISPQNDNISIEALKLIEILKGQIQSEIINTIELNINSENDTIDSSLLDSLGMNTFYNKKELTLFIDIPLDLKKELIVDLKQNKNSLNGIILRPSPFSAYINLYSSLNLSVSGIPSDREILVPVNLGFDSAFNFNSYVFEGDIQLNYNDLITVSNWNARIIKDIESRNIRMKGGTINYPVTQLQSYVPLTGISISRNFSLNPYENTQSLGKQSIILDSPSTVEIHVNGRLLKKLDLPKGKYLLENMQLDSGANNVEIKIKGISGEEQSLFFFQPFNISILKKGLSDFSSTLGIYENEMEIPYYSGYFRYGLSDFLTLGANIQSDFNMFNSGISLLLGTIAGNFSLEGSLSYDDGLDWAASIFYRYTNSRFPYKNNWSITATYRGINYSGIRLEKVNNTIPLRLSFYYGQILPGNINTGLTINRNFNSSWDGGSTEFVLYLSRHFEKGLLVNLFANEKIDDSGENEFSAGLSMTINLQNKNETITSSSSWPGAAIESTWQKSSESRIRGYNINAGISGLPAATKYTPYGFNLGGEYRGYKFTSSFNHNSSFLNINDISLHNSSLHFNSALVYADSTLAMTRPVYDSFVIFKPSETFKKYSIGINPEGKSYGALLEGKGNAVLPGFNSYRKGQILLEAIDLPIGYDLGESAYTFMPTYKSGAMVTVGSSAVIYAGGFLTNDSGKPQILSAFIIRSLDDKNREEELFFTNREGYFEIYGLTEGNWMIELVENREYNSTFTIPRGTTGYYELWNVHLQKGEN